LSSRGSAKFAQQVFETVQLFVEFFVIAPVFDQPAGVCRGRSVAAEMSGDRHERKPGGHVCEINADLARREVRAQDTISETATPAETAARRAASAQSAAGTKTLPPSTRIVIRVETLCLNETCILPPLPVN
jgi:hypothetical protein